MIRITEDIAISEEELRFSASRSGGPGGQHVNKSNTRVTARFDVMNSPNLTEEQKGRILRRLATRVTQDGVLLVSAQRHRSQSMNRDLALARLVELLQIALHRERPRRATRVPEAEKQRRMEEKRRRAKVKRARERPEVGEE